MDSKNTVVANETAVTPSLKEQAHDKANEIREAAALRAREVMAAAQVRADKITADGEAAAQEIIARAEAGLSLSRKGRPKGVKNGEGRKPTIKALVLPDGSLKRLGAGRPPASATVIDVAPEDPRYASLVPTPVIQETATPGDTVVQG